MNGYRTNKFRENQAETEWHDISYENSQGKPENNPPDKPEAVSQPESKKIKKSGKGRKRVQEVLGGDYLSKGTVVNNLPFLIYLTVLALFYISNTYNTERMYKEIERTKTELKELRYRYVTARSNLMFQSKLSELNKRAVNIGLRESTRPPVRIYYSSAPEKTSR